MSAKPLDERKPRIPCTRGWRFTIPQHVPPPPIQRPPFAGRKFDSKAESRKMEQLHPIERCLQFPHCRAHMAQFSLELQVHDTVRVGNCHSAQVVEVEVLTENPPVDGLSQGQHVVAKLYDPMYIDDDEFYVNPFLVADKGYAHETAAYGALYDLQGSAIPRYHGSYSLDIAESQSSEVSDSSWLNIYQGCQCNKLIPTGSPIRHAKAS